MSSPVIVQGTAVSDPYSTASAQPVTNGDWQKGEKQSSSCRDPIFAILFYVNVAAIAGVFFAFGTNPLSETSSTADGDVDSDELLPYVYAVIICGLVSCGLSFCMLLLMMQIPTLLIKVSLIFVVVLGGVIAVFALMSGSMFGGIIGLIFFAIGVCYACMVWKRIPFASANLLTSCTIIKKNCGVIIIALMSVVVAFAWSLLWTLALLGIWNESCETDQNGQTVCEELNTPLMFGMLVSYFFTHQVIQNTVHVICAGVAGTWWFAPEETGCCSSGIFDSACRALTTSFGSICFGSLIVAIIQALRQLANQAREDGSALACVAECILGCIQGIVEYFNKWAYIYVGLYGYGYIDAGKNVITLFKNRGWDAIIADDLIGNVLFLLSLVVGALVGAIAIAAEASVDLLDNTAGSTLIIFILGFIVGVVLCSIFLSPIASATNAVIVLFAEAPAEFQENHPELSNKMRAAWNDAYPGVL